MAKAEEKLKKALQASQQKYSDIFNAANDAIFVHDAQTGKILEVNERALEMLLCSKEEIIGQDIGKFSSQIEPFTSEKTKESFRKVLKEGPQLLEWQAKRKDGEIFWVEVMLQGATIGGIPCILGTTREITKRKEIEKALRQSEAKARALLDANEETVILLSPEATILSCNEVAAKRLGKTREEILGKCIYDLFPPDVAESRRKYFTIAAQTGNPVRFQDERAGRFYEISLYPAGDAPGAMYMVAVYARDITERVQAETERRELEAQLRQSQKLEAVGQLAGGVAHDFNNILTVIAGNLELSRDLIERELGAGHPVLRFLNQMDEASQRASSLTRQLLTFSRRDIVRPQSLNLNSILTGLDGMLQRLISENIRLELLIDPQLKTILGDVGHMEQVIVNLVVNAVHAMPDGGRLMLETKNTVLDEAYGQSHTEAHPGPYVLLEVSDTGHGMDAATREHIFEPFFSTKPADKGTGLGLATVHGIVKQSGGHIIVYSEPGVGSTFKVYLPAVESEVQAEVEETVLPESFFGDETILLCEDDDSVKSLVVKQLEDSGYTVLSARGGEEALRLATNHDGPIHLLITDVIMPDTNGRALSERLQTIRHGLPTLFISGYTSNVISKHGVLEKGVEFVEKPFSKQDLLTKVHSILTRTKTECNN